MEKATALRVQPLELNDEERSLVNELVLAGVLTDPEKCHFQDKLDVVLVGCPDGTRMRSFLDMLLKMYEPKFRSSVQFHILPRHGGGLVLSKGSALIKRKSTLADDLIEEVRDAATMGYRAIVLSTHLPCRKARMNGVGPLTVIGALAEAKARIKRAVEGVTVVCVLQVNNKELYFFSKTKFEAWSRNNRR